MAKKTKSLIGLFGILFCIGFVFRSWLLQSTIIGGDWTHLFEESIRRNPLTPQLWSPLHGNGLGGISPVLNLSLFQTISALPVVFWPYAPWNLVSKITWFGLFLVSSFLAACALGKTIASKGDWWFLLTPVLYLTNTYILMVVGGGQMGVALAYALSPFVLSRFIRLIDEGLFSLRLSVLTGLALGFQLLLDPRISYLTLIGVGLYLLIDLFWSLSGKHWKTHVHTAGTLLFAGLIGLSLNAFWMLPLIVLGNNPLDSLGAAYTSIGSVKFFSFADFPHALSLLQPNWPENVFGKTYFFRPEFLLIPILAFTGLLFVRRNREGKRILFFALLGLLGAFLTKGAKDPFGALYIWLYQHVPGFMVFRDPTKFSVLVAMSYSILLPLTLARVSRLVSGRVRIGLFAACIILWGFTIREAVVGKLGGTFMRRDVPVEYVAFKDMLTSDGRYYRTLWAPRQSRFAYYDELHPTVEAQPLFGATNAAQLKEAFQDPATEDMVSRMAVRYVVVPYDALGELFVTDRVYDPGSRQDYIDALDTIPWLRKIRDDNLTVYETISAGDFFQISDGEISYKKVSPSRYIVDVDTTEQSLLYLAQKFDPGWRAMTSTVELVVQKSDYNLTQILVQPGRYSMQIYFAPQGYVVIGLVIAGMTLLLAAFVLVGRGKVHYNNTDLH